MRRRGVYDRLGCNKGVSIKTLSHLIEQTCHLSMASKDAPQKERMGCNNGIGRFNGNLVTFREPKLPDYQWAQQTRLKNCTF